MELKFEEEAVSFLKFAEKTNKSIYLTWKAGSWKSTLINFFTSKTKKKFVLLGTTGVSAEMIDWQTIHKFFWIWCPFKTYWDIREADTFIIDEASMNRADLFDIIEAKMRKVMKNDLFFGWKQLILVGDLYQLPPVPERKETVKLARYDEKYEWLYFFYWKSYDKDNFELIQLKKVYRQDDLEFVNMLNMVRIGNNSQKVLDYFNQNVISESEIKDNSILISTTNKIAQNYNINKLDEIDKKQYVSRAIIMWEYPEDIYPNELYINYKVWARVMFTVNEQFKLYVNWTLWIITKIENNKVFITKDDWWELAVDKRTWLNIDGKDKFWNDIIIWKFIQYPFKLAFAITIHKCQGKTFDNVVVDLWWWAFASGQVYVAFSRATSFTWLQLLKTLKAKDIRTSREVINFLK